jgi:phthalate 4,5-cis-dihydrodiol dehydrogenase
MTQNARDQADRLGIAGLGMAGAVMVHAAAAHGGYVLKAAADPHAGPREAFARDHKARAYSGAEELMADPAVQAVLHRDAAPVSRSACGAGRTARASTSSWKSRLALTLADCDTILAAVEKHKVHLVVGHTHAFDPNVRLMRDIIARASSASSG